MPRVRVPPPALDETGTWADSASSPRGVATLVHHYQHLHNELGREKPEGSTRRELEDKLFGVRERFDRLLEEWVPDEELREEWREYIHNRRPEPDEPAAIERLAFEGLTDAGSVVQVRGQADEYQVWVDGSLQERIAARKDLSFDKPVLHFRWDGKEIAETFNASQDALTCGVPKLRSHSSISLICRQN